MRSQAACAPASAAIRGRGSGFTPFALPLALFVATAGMGLWAAYDTARPWAEAWLIVGALGIYWAMAHQPDGPGSTSRWPSGPASAWPSRRTSR